ncbi:TM0106 family RecB-like putative nuclease [Sphingomonas koreensis]|nr:TM0106 family RecB-like putative nuclease [Sphingomonas koreensis]
MIVRPSISSDSERSSATAILDIVTSDGLMRPLSNFPKVARSMFASEANSSCDRSAASLSARRRLPKSVWMVTGTAIRMHPNRPDRPRDVYPRYIDFVQRMLHGRRMAGTFITGSMLHDLIRCDRRVALDVHGDASARDEVNEFVELLWEGGVEHEEAVLAEMLAASPGAVDLRYAAPGSRQALTLIAMDAKAPLIVAGEISEADLLGRPDLIRRDGDGYVAGDIKLGAAEDGQPGAPQLRFGVQVCLYADILKRMDRLSRPFGFVIDGNGDELGFALDVHLGGSRGSLVDRYDRALEHARDVVDDTVLTLSIQAAECKLCRWYSECKADVLARDDLTRIPQLGRTLRDALMRTFPTVAALADADVEMHVDGRKTVFPGLGAERLRRFQDRARLLSTSGATPYARQRLSLPPHGRELLFDIETDPMADHCYLHGIVERWTDGSGRPAEYHAFISSGPDDEVRAFVEALEFLEADPSASIIYWSKYERTIYRSLAAKYPETDTVDRVDALFSSARCVDLLYDVVAPHTDWPCHDYSVKTLAVHCGFAWRDTKPSGAASIRWYRDWQRSGDDRIRTRILEYNEDDNWAVAAVLDILRWLPVRA